MEICKSIPGLCKAESISGWGLISGYKETTGSASGARCLVKALLCFLAFAAMAAKSSYRIRR